MEAKIRAVSQKAIKQGSQAQGESSSKEEAAENLRSWCSLHGPLAVEEAELITPVS